jgi:branched-chain amino acid aminotransferase
MFVCDWNRKEGWQKPEIKPYGPFKIATSATCLHYGISCFEGVSTRLNKETKKPQAFRIDKYLDRFLSSTMHIDMPAFD